MMIRLTCFFAGISLCVTSPLDKEVFLRHLFDSRIVGGQAATPGQFPYMVAMMYGSEDILYCGATWVKGPVLRERVFVLTAAHCTDNIVPGIHKMVFGLQNTKQTNAAGVLKLDILNTIIHPGYNSVSPANDLAVIEVDGTYASITANSWATPIDLPVLTYNGDDAAVVCGWGHLQSGGSSPDDLHYVNKTLLTLDDCKTNTNIPAYMLDSTMMCAGDTGIDACQGDSGGPLVDQTRNAIVVKVYIWKNIPIAHSCPPSKNDGGIGVVSWGFGCGDEGYPGVYADVFFNYDWLKNLIDVS